MKKSTTTSVKTIKTPISKAKMVNVTGGDNIILQKPIIVQRPIIVQ